MNKHVDFSNGDIVIVHKKQLGQFIRQSDMNTDNSKYRFCMHDSPDNALQEMFIVRKRGEYSQPDRHFRISETHMIMEGEEAVLLFDESGRILDVIFLGGSDGVLAYRINAPIYHMTVALSESAIDYEVKPGPFVREMNKYPVWAPLNTDIQKVREFMEYIMGEIDKRRNNE